MMPNQRRTNRAAVAKSLRDLGKLFWDMKQGESRIQNEIAGLQPGEIEKAENYSGTLPQPSQNWQGGHHE